MQARAVGRHATWPNRPHRCRLPSIRRPVDAPSSTGRHPRNLMRHHPGSPSPTSPEFPAPTEIHTDNPTYTGPGREVAPHRPGREVVRRTSPRVVTDPTKRPAPTSLLVP